MSYLIYFWLFFTYWILTCSRALVRFLIINCLRIPLLLYGYIIKGYGNNSVLLTMSNGLFLFECFIEANKRQLFNICLTGDIVAVKLTVLP